MRILLVSLNEETLPDPVYPLGLACLAGTLKRRGHSCELMDLSLEGRGEPGLTASDFGPDLVAVSIRNIDNVAYPQSTTYIADYTAFCHQLRQSVSCPVVLGGSGFSLYPERIMAELGADYGIIGSGEGPLLELVESLEAGKEARRVHNLLWRENGTVLRNDLSETPLPDAPPDRDIEHLTEYVRLGGMANIQTRRGCPLGCIYCSYPLIEGRCIRQRSIDSVIEEIEELTALGFRDLFFVDSVFNQPLEYSKALCSRILDRNLSVRWTCYASPAPLDREAVELYKRSGCIGLEFGTDSLSRSMLHSLGKGFTPNDVQRAAALCRKLELPHCHSILVGGPGETADTLEETVLGLESLDPTAVIFMTGIRIIPGTALHQTAREEGLVDLETDMLEPVFYLSKTVQPDLDRWVRQLARHHKNWVFPGHSIRHSAALAARIRRNGIRGPLWLNFSTLSR